MLTFHTGMTLCKNTFDLSSRFPLHGSNVAQGHALGSRNGVQKGDQWSAFQLDARACIHAREEQEGWFYSTSIQLRVPLRVAARRSAWAERHNEVRLAFSLMLISPDKPTFSHSSPRRILAILDWDFGGSHALQFTDRGFEVCWPDLDDVDVRIKDAEEIGRFQTLIDQLAGALPVDVKLNQLVLSTGWYVLNQEALKPYTWASTCLDDSGKGMSMIRLQLSSPSPASHLESEQAFREAWNGFIWFGCGSYTCASRPNKPVAI